MNLVLIDDDGKINLLGDTKNNPIPRVGEFVLVGTKIVICTKIVYNYDMRYVYAYLNCIFA